VRPPKGATDVQPGGTKEKAPASISVPFRVFLVRIQQQQMSDLLTGIRGETLYISREMVI
jgi:hypothetical protein